MISFKFAFLKRHFAAVMLFAFAFSSCQKDPVLDANNDQAGNGPAKTRAFITLIQLNNFPSNDPNGLDWDSAFQGGTDSINADIFFNITDPSPQPPVFWAQNSHFSDVEAGDTVAYQLQNNEYEVMPFGSSIDVNIYDYELPDSTFMGKVNFTIGPFSTDPTYPAYVTKEENGYSVTIGIRWE
jgi:hypothetical protein